MTAPRVGLLALALTSGCLRFGYGVPGDAHELDASQRDASAAYGGDASLTDAGTERDAATGGAGGRAGRDATVMDAGAAGAAGQASAGASGRPSAGAGGAIVDAGSEEDRMLGDSGLQVRDILGYYDGDWGQMVLRRVEREIWGVYEYSGGTIVGEITGDGVFVGWWTQLPSREGLNAGEVEFRWLQNSTDPIIHLRGRWRYGDDGLWLENWNVDLVTDREPPSSLTTGFDTPADFRRHP